MYFNIYHFPKTYVQKVWVTVLKGTPTLQTTSQKPGKLTAALSKLLSARFLCCISECKSTKLLSFKTEGFLSLCTSTYCLLPLR